MQQPPPCGAGERLFLSQELSDFSFTVRDRDKSPWRFPIHTMVLSSQSVVFKSMFENEFSEKETRNAFISDINPRVMELLLGYFYKGTANLSSWLDGRELLQAGHKYQVEPLVQHCARFLETVLTLSNVCYIYNDATLYSLATLREKSLRLILDAGFLLLRSKSFEVLTKEAVMDIITSSSLNIENELMVFEALLRWAPMQCCRLGLPVTEANILQELEPFLKFMCFDDMSDTEKSALPPAVLSLVQPSNRNRVSHYVPDSLMSYCSSFTLREDPDTALEFIAPSLTLVAFSISAPAHMIGLRFTLPLTEFPCAFTLTMTRQIGSSRSSVSLPNLSSATFTEGEKVNGLTSYDVAMTLNKPCWLEAKTVYQLEMVDRSQRSHCAPGTRVETETVLTERGSISISIHCQNVYGITGISIL
ncbi:hypothetical protein JTE90_025161 [Oedothorax gibbosus]|uniref:BTB domain-containing protein n=1 Tax=Oedothorax gibbosus TaxID=931172 RepID=A0AAV6UHG0_9ARAC|nr:hypothetical protein JTE90_025161 [Oedothorax gibbosus]